MGCGLMGQVLTSFLRLPACLEEFVRERCNQRLCLLMQLKGSLHKLHLAIHASLALYLYLVFTHLLRLMLLRYRPFCDVTEAASSQSLLFVFWRNLDMSNCHVFVVPTPVRSLSWFFPPHFGNQIVSHLSSHGVRI